MTTKRWMGVGVVAVSLLAFAAAVVLGCGGEPDGGAGLAVDESLRGEGGMDKTMVEQPEEAEAWDLQSGTAAGESGTVAPSTSTLPQFRMRVVKTALMRMETEKGGYAKVREEALAMASAAGGYMEGESSSRDDEGLTYATLTLRIPADRFDGVVSDAAELGEVTSTEVSTEDVSAEYVDLESRLKHLQAEESFYLSLIAKAQTIQEMVTIREHLDAIQLEKEQVQGRMDFLDQQAGFSTLTLSVSETGPEDGEGFWDSVADAFKSFGRGIKKLAVGFFYALPYLVILAVISVTAWLLIRRSRKTPSES